MAKQLNVNLAFTADTRAAQQQLQQLQHQLDQIVRPGNGSIGNGLSTEIQKGITAASELKVKLLEATNVNTGKLDLTKFSQSLQASNRQLEDYARDLAALGPQGSEAFISVARAISNAETPFIRLGARANEFLTTLKNTARWQFSSSMLHGFIGTLQHAYGYAQDLNKSLNNIRIVTGKSTEDMARFAKEANAAAKGLSATTLDYTDASLIYYQQGLDDQAVKARTDVTIKLANVSRQSAEEVSDQMTAIWNNFAEGSENLEYYADVITALGAATASSSEEISTGLEKFAAVSKTVGLSYEYATAALATITATTRQSADTVGTGLRTLFARLEGLKLGETLEDGVDLNKYSQALRSIGVEILDVNGEIKDMDTILNETAAGWDTLSKAQQIAFAQTVGGVRQYTNLIALMDNWDFMQSNLNVARGAKGTLQQQADIYAESWEAAQKRVKASAEAIYDALLNDKFFINLTKGLATILDGINSIIKSAGGLRGIILGLGAVLSRVFNASLTKTISNMALSISSLGKGKQQAIDNKNRAWNAAVETLQNDGSTYGQQRAENIKEEARLQKQLIDNASTMSEEERKIYQIRLDIIRSYQEEAAEQAKILDQMEAKAGKMQTETRGKILATPGASINDFNQYIASIRAAASRARILEPIQKEFENLHDEQFTLDELKQKILGLSGGEQAIQKLAVVFQLLEEDVNHTTFSATDFKDLLQASLEDDQAAIERLAQKFKDPLRKEVEATGAAVREADNQEGKFADTTKRTEQVVEELGGKLPNLSSKYQQLAESIAQTIQLMSSLGFAISGIVGFIDNLRDALDDGKISFAEFGTLLTSFSMVAMSLMSTFNIAGKLLPHLGVSLTAVEGSVLATKVAVGALTFSLGQFLLVLGLIAGAAIVFYQLINHDEIAVKKLTKENEKLTEATAKTHEEFNSLKTDLENYDDALETLRNATQNTEEWAQAARDVNDALANIKQNYPDIWAKAETKIENGQLVITNQKQLLEEAQNRVTENDQLLAANSFRVAEAQMNLDNKQNPYSLHSKFMGTHSLDNETLARVVDILAKEEINAENIEAKVREIFSSGAYDYDRENFVKAFTSESGLANLLNIKNQRISNESGRISAANSLAYQLMGSGYTDESYQAVVDKILSEDSSLYKNDEEFLTAIKNAIEGMDLVKVPENTANINGESVNIGGELTNIEALKKTLSDENASAGDYLNLGINWKALGAELTDFVNLTTEEQERLLTNYEINLKRAELDAREAEIENLKGKEKLEAQEQLNIDKALLEQKALSNLAKAYDLDAKKVENLADYYREYADEVEGLSDDLNDELDRVTDLAILHNRLNKGLQELTNNWDEYQEVLDTGVKNTEEYQTALSNIYDHVKDIIGLDTDLLGDDFVEKQLDTIRRVAKGDKDAIDELKRAAADEIFLKFSVNTDEAREKCESFINQLHDWAASENFEIGATIDDTQFLNACQEMIAAAGFTATQAGEYFKALGYNIKIHEVEHTSYSDSNVADMLNTLASTGHEGRASAFRNGGVNKNVNRAKTTIRVPVVEAITYTGKSGGIANITSQSGGGGGGGGGSEKKTKDEGDMDRYHYIKETIEDLETAYSRASKEKDRLFGGDRVDAINAEIKAIDNLIKEQDIYLDSIEDYLNKDAANLIAKVQEYTGISPILDEVGRIVNYDEIMQAGIKKYNNDTSDKADDNWSDFEESISTYEGTKNLREEQRERRADLVRERQDKNFEKLNYVVDLRVNVNERELQVIQNSIDLLGDSVYKSAERLDLLWSNSANVTDKFDNLNSSINIQIGQFGKLENALEAGKISQEQYMKGLEQVRDQLQKNLETLIAYDDEMRTYYSTTLSAASAEMDFWNKQLEHGTKVLEHYKKVAELSGNQQNYGMLSILLKGQKVTTENEYNVAKNWFETVKKQRESIEEEMNEAQQKVEMYEGNKDSKEYKAAVEQVEWLRDKFNAIEEEYIEAEESMYSKLENFLEAAKADLENDLDEISDRYEKLMSNGLGFDYINSDLDKLKKIDDEWLTKTNQVYETTKFLRQIQSDMDKTDNVAAKEKLKNWTRIVESMKEQGKLSQVELEIAKRKYEIELAQMALEDAKNAKSIVRLSRDSEGNYGYVYSADPDKAADAEQALLDKQNDLYNYARETYNDNKQKLTELWSQQQEELLALEEYYYMNGLDLDETYWEKRNGIIKRYEELAIVYQKNCDDTKLALNEVALTDYTEAYASAYDDINSNTKDWHDNTQSMVKEIHAEYVDWKRAVDQEVRPVIGKSLGELQQKTDEVENSSDTLANTINTEVIPALGEELSNVDEVTEAYGRQRDAIWEVIEALQVQMSLIDQQFSQASTEASKSAGDFDEHMDYGVLTAAYLANGGKIGDAGYRQIMAQTDAKIDWMKSQGYGRDKWGYTAAERTERYKNMTDAQILADAQGLTKDEVIRMLKTLGINISFASGGYTGEWGDQSGRVGILHQKELILNEDDTANMLSVVKFVRDIANMIDLQAVSAAAGLGYLTTPTIGSTSSELDQNVHIEANFPNVTDHNEIEQALTTLVNRAAQFANRK